MTQEEREKSTGELVSELEDARRQIAELRHCVEAGERQLAAEKKRSVLLDMAPDPIFELTPEGSYAYGNQALAEVFGRSPEEVTGKTLWDFFPRDDAERRFAVLSEVFRTGEATTIEGPVPRSDGDRYYVTFLRPLRDAAGRVVSVMGTARDGTASRAAEAALRESEGRLQRLLTNTDTGFTVIDDKGIVLVANEPYARMSGARSAESLLGRSVIEWTAPEEREANAAAVAACARYGFIKDFETTHQHTDGTKVRISIDATMQKGADGKVQLVSYCRDITERKRAEEAKARLESRLQQAERMESVGRLAGGVAHDFNNMLTVILGNADMALQQVDPSLPLHADLTELRAAAEHSAALTTQLLAFARKQAIAPRVLSLNDTVAGMLKMLERLIGEDIRLAWRPGGDLWPVRVDPSQIDQILANLCVNARDAIADVGSVTIETGNITLDEEYCANHPGCAPGDYVRLSVRDDGCGIDKETVDQLFEPFFTTKPVGEGTGLGLATVYGIVRQNEGFITVDSEPGRGATFRIHLPRHRGEAPARTATGPGSASRGRETILLVEDEPAILRLSRRQLELLGYTVLSAATPGAAIRLAAEHAGVIDLLMTDVIMPEMNGRDLASKLLALYPYMARLFVSGYTADVIAHHGVLEAGMHFIQKPFSRETLAAKVRAALGER